MTSYKKPPRMSLTVILLLCLFPTSVFNYSFNGRMIRDLESNEYGAFMTDVVGKWSSTAKTSSPIIHSLCSSTYMIGGPDADQAHRFQRRYSKLPDHDIIYFALTVSLIDNWHPNSSFAILFDQQDYDVGLFLMDTTSFPQDECGEPAYDLTGVRFYGKVKHKGKSLTLSISSLAHDDDVKSLGFRDLTLLFRSFTEEEKYNLNKIKNNNCALASIPLQLKECQCLEGQYVDSTGSCQSCDPLCKTCLGPATSQCLSCSENAFWDGTQCAQCDSSCATCKGATETSCLSCNSGDYFFNGKACSSTCDLPLTPGTSDPLKPTCTSSCDSDHYLFKDGTCPSTCPSTYHAFEAHGSKFCYEYCSAGMYYVPSIEENTDGVCVAGSCPAVGYYQDNTPRYCKACKDSLCTSCPTNNGETCQACEGGSILDFDGACKKCESMEVTYVQSTDKGAKYEMTLEPSTCTLSTAFVKQNLAALASGSSTFPSFSVAVSQDSSMNTDYSLEISFTSSVLQAGEMEVSLQYLSATLQVPKSLIASSELQNLASYVPAAKAMVTAAIGGSLAGTFALGATASLWSIINFQQFVGYFVYINIEYPFQVNMLYDLLDSANFNFLPNPIAKLTSRWSDDILTSGSNADPKYKPPAKFVENGMTSFFIDNAGSLVFINILFFLILLLIVLLRRTKKFKRSTALKKIKSVMKWNVILRAFLENGIPIMLAVFLQVRIMGLNNVYVAMCSILALVSLTYCLIMTGITTKILGSQNSSQLGKEVAQNTYGTLYEGMSLEQDNSKYYNLLVFLRGVLLVFLLAFCSAIPIIQIAMLIPYNMGLIFYLFKEASFEDKNLTRVNRVKEILILIAEFCILALTFDMQSEGYYNILGWIIVGCFAGGLLIETMYMIILQIYNIRTIKKKVVEFWNIVCRWVSNASAKRKHRRHRLRKIHPQGVQVELTPVKEEDETAETEIKFKGLDLKVTDLVNPMTEMDESNMKFKTDHSTIRFPTDMSMIA